jgi:hypothetical protein
VATYCALLSTLTFRQHIRGNTGVWTKDVTDTDFTAVGANNNTQIVYDKSPNQYPPAGTQNYTGVPYQGASPYPPSQPQTPALYAQPQANTGSFTQPQAQTGTGPYPQV